MLFAKRRVTCNRRRTDIVPSRMRCVFESRINEKRSPIGLLLAGETRLEHATDGFGDRCSTIEPLPYAFNALLL